MFCLAYSIAISFMIPTLTLLDPGKKKTPFPEKVFELYHTPQILSINFWEKLHPSKVAIFTIEALSILGAWQQALIPFKPLKRRL